MLDNMRNLVSTDPQWMRRNDEYDERERNIVPYGMEG